MARRRETHPLDLDPYPGDDKLGMKPVAVGWLRGDRPYPTGPVRQGFLEKLLPYCYEQHSLPGARATARCALSRDCPRIIQPIQQGDNTAYFDGEIRVIGDDDIYAAPALIHHYITVHNYRPPDEFIQAVLHGPPPDSPEHRALIKTLRG